jgi:ankyrin repeat protein
VLSLAFKGGDPEVVRLLLDAGAEVHYVRDGGYTAATDAVHGGWASEAALCDVLRMLVTRGCPLDGVSRYGESALSVTSRTGQFAVVRLLLEAVADPSPLEWTPLARAIALGTPAEMESALAQGADLEARDGWQRTPWLLSLQAGDMEKARRLLAAGADRQARGRCGKVPLMYAVESGGPAMLRWLLAEGFDPEEADEFGGTPLIEAAERGATECVRILLEAGANVHRSSNTEKPIQAAANLEIVNLLVAYGADLQEISDTMRAAMTGVPGDGRIDVTEEAYRAGKHRRFGCSNPELMNVPFWLAMVRSGATAYSAWDHFEGGAQELDACERRAPVWCFRRFGKSITPLPDGRIVEIAGEHEDSYDPDFCIYNDVVVHHGDGRIDLYGYPQEVFPPTDFHTATLVGKFIYIIGSLGYPGARAYGRTPVYRLNVDSFVMEPVDTTGEMPGWIHGHRAVTEGEGAIRLRGGKRCVAGESELQDNTEEYVLDLASRVWRKV